MKTVPYTRRGYITFLDYAATGEGHTVEIHSCWADNEEDAIKKHFIYFKYKGNSVRDHFRPGMVVMDSSGEEAKDLLMHYFKDGAKMFSILQDAPFELSFRYAFNLG